MLMGTGTYIQLFKWEDGGYTFDDVTYAWTDEGTNGNV